MDKNTKAYFIREMTQKTRLARILDRLLLLAAAYIIAYLWYGRQMHNSLAIALLSAVTALLAFVSYLLWFSIRLDKFTAKKMAALVREATLELLLLLPPAKIMDILLSSDKELQGIRAVAVVDDGFVARFADGQKALYSLLKKHPNEPVTATELMAEYQRSLKEGCDRLTVFSTAEYCADAKALVKDGHIPAKLNPPKRLLELAESLELLPDQECVQKAVRKHIQRQKPQAAEMLKGGPRRYLLCAALLTALSFFTVYSLYYRIIAAICLALAYFSAKQQKQSEKTAI